MLMSVAKGNASPSTALAQSTALRDLRRRERDEAARRDFIDSHTFSLAPHARGFRPGIARQRGRMRVPRSMGCRTRGSRRVTSRSAGGGSSGDDPGGDPEPGEKPRPPRRVSTPERLARLVLVAAASIAIGLLAAAGMAHASLGENSMSPNKRATIGVHYEGKVPPQPPQPPRSYLDDDLVCAKMDAEGCIYRSRENIEWFRSGRPNPEHYYGTGTTIEDAVKQEEEVIRRCEQELEEVEAEILVEVEARWREMFPEDPSLSELEAIRGEPFDAKHGLLSRLWEEIYGYGAGWSEGLDGLNAAATDICVDMFQLLGVDGMCDLVRGLRERDLRKITPLLARLSTYDRQKGHDTYNVIYAIRGGDDSLRLMIDQRINCVHGLAQQRRTGLIRFARRCWGARQRSSHGKASRTRGSRRVTSRSAGGGSSGDDPPGESEPPGLAPWRQAGLNCFLSLRGGQ